MTICRYSEAQFKALKYRDGFPVQFGSIETPAHTASSSFTGTTPSIATVASAG